MNLLELRHSYGQLMTQANAIATKGFDNESRASFDKMIADSDAMYADIQRMEKAEKASAELRTSVAPPRNFQSRTEDHKEQEKRSFLNWLRTGREQRDLGSAASGLTAGAQFVPTLITPLVDAKQSYGTLLENVSILRDSFGGQLNIPLVSDVANSFSIVGQGTSATTSVDPTISSVSSNTDTVQTLIRISNELLQDANFDMRTGCSRNSMSDGPVGSAMQSRWVTPRTLRP